MTDAEISDALILIHEINRLKADNARLRAENAELRTALEPFATEGREWGNYLVVDSNDHPVISAWDGSCGKAEFTIGDLIRASNLLREKPQGAPPAPNPSPTHADRATGHESAGNGGAS